MKGKSGVPLLEEEEEKLTMIWIVISKKNKKRWSWLLLEVLIQVTLSPFEEEMLVISYKNLSASLYPTHTHMEIPLAKWIALVGILAWVFMRVMNWLWLKPKKLEKCLRQQGFTGNSYTLFYGDLKEHSIMLSEAMSKPIKLNHDISPRVYPLIHHTIQKYGKNSFIWGGPMPRVIIMNPELIRDVFTKHGDFHRPLTNPLINLLITGIINYEGDKWVKHRKIVNSAFHLEKLKKMQPAFHQSCNDLMRKWEKMVTSEGSCELDAWPFFETLTGDVISRTAFGSSYEEGTKIFHLQREQVPLIIQYSQSVYIPGMRFLPTKMNKRMKEIDEEVQALLMRIVNKREKAMKAGEVANDDLLGILMDFNFKEIQKHGNDKNIGLSTQEVIEECKLFYFAGQETTSVLLSWTMVMLSTYPDWQVRAREEVFQVFENKKPDIEGLNHLKIVTMILYEVLRLYPPAPLLTRALFEETKLGKLSLPGGIHLLIPTVLVHRDHDLWGEDANEFKPERFSEGVSKATKNQASFFPFGGGPRICVGQNFAMIEVKMTLAMILQRFSFQLSPSYAHAPVDAITLQPQYGVHLILQKK